MSVNSFVCAVDIPQGLGECPLITECIAVSKILLENNRLNTYFCSECRKVNQSLRYVYIGRVKVKALNFHRPTIRCPSGRAAKNPGRRFINIADSFSICPKQFNVEEIFASYSSRTVEVMVLYCVVLCPSDFSLKLLTVFFFNL